MDAVITVELDAMSGRLNPSWTLDDAEANALRALVAGLFEPAAEPTARLGYRGFVVWTAASPSWLRVRHGTVTVHEGASSRTRRDSTGIEAWLRQQAEARGYGALVGPSAR